jgi:hypothetical protein
MTAMRRGLPVVVRAFVTAMRRGLPVVVRALVTTIRRGLPVVVLAVVTMTPVLLLARRLEAPTNVVQARGQLALGWAIAATAWVCQLWLVAGAAPSARAQLDFFTAVRRGMVGLARALVPWAIAVIAIGLGFAAMLAPGFVLLVLLAQTGASVRLGEAPPTPLLDGVASVRRNVMRVALIVGALLVVDVAIAVAAQLVIAKPLLLTKPPPGALAAAHTFARAVALGVSAIAPVPAWLLARTYTPSA